MPVMERTKIASPTEALKLPKDNVSAARKTTAINAVREMQEISAFRGNDKMTLEEINTVIADVRRNGKK